MAVRSPTNFTVGGGDEPGLREDLSNLAPRMITPDDAPLYKGLRRTKATAVLHEYTTDTLSRPAALPTPPLFSAEPTYTSTATKGRRGNRVQLFEKTWKIARALEILSNVGGSAGVASEVQREIGKHTREMAMDVEFTLISEQAAVTDNGSVGAKLAGFFDATSGINTNVTDLAAAAMSTVGEGDVKTKLLDLFNSGSGMNLKAFLPPAIKKAWSETFTGRPNSRVVIQQGNSTIETAVDTYLSPVGPITLDLVPNRTMTAQAIVFADMDQLALAELEKVSVFENDPTNFRNRQGWMETMVTLETGAEAASGGWKGDSTPS